MPDFTWNGAQSLAAIDKVINARMDAAAIYLVGKIKEELSRPGTATVKRQGGYTRTEFRSVYRPGVGPIVITIEKYYRKGQRIYGFERSKPGEPPRKQTGHLRRSIAWERGANGERRIGTNLEYGKFLELGTSKMKPRPFLRTTLTKETSNIRRIIDSGKMPDQTPPATYGEMVIV